MWRRGQALHHGGEVDLHDRKLTVRRRLHPQHPHLVPDEKRVRHGHRPRRAREEAMLHGVEKRAKASHLQPDGQLVEDGASAGDWELEHRVPVRDPGGETLALLCTGGSWLPDSVVRSECSRGIRMADVGDKAFGVVLVQCNDRSMSLLYQIGFLDAFCCLDISSDFILMDGVIVLQIEL